MKQPKTPTETFNAKFPIATLDKLRELARVNKRSIRAEIEIAVDRYLKDGNQ